MQEVMGEWTRREVGWSWDRPDIPDILDIRMSRWPCFDRSGEAAISQLEVEILRQKPISWPMSEKETL
jgi:hypothetical protein